MNTPISNQFQCLICSFQANNPVVMQSHDQKHTKAEWAREISGARAKTKPKSKLAQVPQEDISEVDIINVIYGEKDGAFTVDMRKVQRLRSFISREKAKSYNEGFHRALSEETQAFQKKVRKALKSQEKK